MKKILLALFSLLFSLNLMGHGTINIPEMINQADRYPQNEEERQRFAALLSEDDIELAISSLNEAVNHLNECYVQYPGWIKVTPIEPHDPDLMPPIHLFGAHNTKKQQEAAVILFYSVVADYKQSLKDDIEPCIEYGAQLLQCRKNGNDKGEAKAAAELFSYIYNSIPKMIYLIRLYNAMDRLQKVGAWTLTNEQMQKAYNELFAAGNMTNKFFVAANMTAVFEHFVVS